MLVQRQYRFRRRACSQAEPYAMVPTMLSQTPILPPTILVVEDSPDDAMVIELTFRRAGISNPLVFVEDGAMAVDYLLGRQRYQDRDRWPVPVLVILDLNLPKHDGFQVLERTHQLRADYEVETVVLSVSDDEADKERVATLGVKKMLQKPIEPTSLMGLISEFEAFSLLIIPRRLEDEPVGFD